VGLPVDGVLGGAQATRPSPSQAVQQQTEEKKENVIVIAGQAGPRGEQGPPGTPYRPPTTTTPIGQLMHTHAEGSMAEYHFQLHTYTDDGAVWGEMSSLYHTPHKLDHKRPPGEHHPIIMSAFSYVTIKMNISYFPIPPLQGKDSAAASASIEPPSGHLQVVLLCYPEHVGGSMQYRCVIAKTGDVQKPKSTTPTQAILSQNDVFLAAEVFSNSSANLLHLSPDVWPELENIWYLDLLVAHQPQLIFNPSTYGISGKEMVKQQRVYWSADVDVQYRQL